MIDVNQITSTLRGMPDQQLQQYAMMHKGDPYILSLAVSESNQRKKMRMAAQGQAGGMPQPKVADAAIAGMAQQQLPEDQGIARIPAPNMQYMADGGIAGYGDGDDVPRQNGMAQGGMYDFAQRTKRKQFLMRLATKLPAHKSPQHLPLQPQQQRQPHRQKKALCINPLKRQVKLLSTEKAQSKDCLL